MDRRSLARPTRLAVTAATLALASPLALAVAPAQACACPDEGIAALAPSRTVDPGEQFRVRGIWIEDGEPAAGRVVVVQTRRDGKWLRLRGARVTTRATGEFGLRLVLQQPGRRVLRVVGVDPAGPDPKDRFSVRVGTGSTG